MNNLLERCCVQKRPCLAEIGYIAVPVQSSWR